MNPKIGDVMTCKVECAHPEMTIREAAAKMKERDIGSLPVCEGAKLVGIVTDRDITLRATAEGKNPNLSNVGEIMTREIVSVGPDQSLQEAERLMHDFQLRRLPVVNERGELAGYLALAKVARNENAGQAGKVLQGVSQPHAPEPMAKGPSRIGRKTG